MTTQHRKCILVALPVCFSLLLGSTSLYAKDESIEARAARIHAEVLTLDTHVDTPMRLLRPDFDLGERHDPRKSGRKVDFPRMKEGGLDAVFFAVYVRQGPRTLAGNSRAKERAIRTFDAIHEAIKACSNVAELALTPDDAYRIEKAGKRAIYVGMENGYPLGNDISLIRRYYDLGARYITLCHTRNNDICDSSTDKSEHHGLSAFGEKVVAEMNRLGMLIDVSHISDEAFYDVVGVSKAPVVASHSCARALCNHPRNLDDAMLRKLAENGGVIQICVLSSYVKKPARRLATTSDAVDHIDHIVRVVGIDHVGIGTDFDGGGGLDGCYDVSEIGNITLELVRRGYSKEQIRKIWGGNFMRVFCKAIEVAEEFR